MDQNLFEIKGAWSPEEDEILQNLLKKHGLRNWTLISKSIPGRSGQSCRSRWLSLDSLFTSEEDEMLQNLVEKHGPNWSLISTSIPGKSGQSCRSRWLSHQVEHRPFTPEEGETILRAHARFGNNCWGAISELLNGRTYGEVEHYLNLTLKRKSSLMANEDITIGAHSIYIPPPSFSDINRGKGKSYIHDGNLSHEVGGVSGHQAPSFSDIMGFDMSMGGTHSYGRNEPAPSWNALIKRDMSSMMNENSALKPGLTRPVESFFVKKGAKMNRFLEA